MERMPKTVAEQLGERLWAIRKERGESQQQFVRTIGLGRTYYARVERGEASLSVVNVALVARRLGIAISELFDGIEMSRSEQRAFEQAKEVANQSRREAQPGTVRPSRR